MHTRFMYTRRIGGRNDRGTRRICTHSRPLVRTPSRVYAHAVAPARSSSLLFIMRNVNRRGHFIYRRNTRARTDPPFTGVPFRFPPSLALERAPPPFYPLAVSQSREGQDNAHVTHNGGVKNGSLYVFQRAFPHFFQEVPVAEERVRHIEKVGSRTKGTALSRDAH